MFYHVTLKENLTSILENGIIAQTGERSKELDDFGVYLFANKKAMDDANWFWELFDDDDELVILEIELPENWKLHSDIEYEVCSNDNIPNEFIVRVLDESMQEVSFSGNFKIC